jgi:hypothetical protein
VEGSTGSLTAAGEEDEMLAGTKCCEVNGEPMSKPQKEDWYRPIRRLCSPPTEIICGNVNT